MFDVTKEDERAEKGQADKVKWRCWFKTMTVI